MNGDPKQGPEDTASKEAPEKNNDGALSSSEIVPFTGVDASPQHLNYSTPPSPAGEAGDSLAGSLEGQLQVGVPEVVERFGGPVVTRADKDDNIYIVSVNQAFWAGLYASEHIIIYEPSEGLFYQYGEETGLYTVISPDVIKQAISARLLEASREHPDWGRLEHMRTDKLLTAIVAHLRGIVEQRGFFANKPLRSIHLSNRVLVFFDGLRGGSGFSEKYRSRNRSPICYDPSAKCPRFLEDLLLPAVADDDVALLQKIAGQFLLGENLIQRLLIVDGLAEQGKTQLANVLQDLVGRENVSQLRTRHLGERFELSRLLGHSLLVGVDVDEDFLSTPGASVIKGLVGDDWFDAERKGSNASFRFQGKFNIIMTSNSRLRVRLQRDTGAWRRRLLIVRCEGPPLKRKIPKFGELLIREEGAGILNWALEGLTKLLADIEETGDIRLTSRQSGVVEDLLAESDSVRVFLTDHVEKECGVGLSVAQLCQAYAEFCGGRGWAPLPDGKIHGQLKSLMRELFHVEQSHDFRGEGYTARGYRGVVLTRAGG